MTVRLSCWSSGLLVSGPTELFASRDAGIDDQLRREGAARPLQWSFTAFPVKHTAKNVPKTRWRVVFMTARLNPLDIHFVEVSAPSLQVHSKCLPGIMGKNTGVRKNCSRTVFQISCLSGFCVPRRWICRWSLGSCERETDEYIQAL